MTRGIAVSAALSTVLLISTTACSASAGDASSGSGSGSGSGGGMSVTIAEPSEGAAVQLPFTLRLESSVPLGPTESGQHHVHVFFDGDDSTYEVVESDSIEISNSSKAAAGLSPGKHELNVSLRNADHSPAGAETKISVDVGGTGGGQPQPQPPANGGGGGY
jgi:hypothetical protein